MQQRTRMALVVLALPLWAACSVLVDPESLQVRCEIDGGDMAPDPCLPLGQQCINNVCRDCDSEQRELCNGRDDDCDSEIDEGHDADKDGFTWCGFGKVEMADCVDSDDEIHPPSTDQYGSTNSPTEDCDGKDNDCDSKVDEDPKCAEMMQKCTADSACLKDQRCDVKSGVCLCTADSACPKDQRCDVKTGVCFVPREVGSGCTNDSDCKGGFCLRPGSLFELPVELKDNRCATACCSTADCDDESSCLISDAGARVCLPKTIVGGGSRKAGERCVRDSECASGVCQRTCQTRCFNAAACPMQECVLSATSTSEGRVFVCGQPEGLARAGEPCGLGLGACRSGYCGEDFTACGQPCGRDEDCTGMNHSCVFRDVRQVLGPASVVSVCERRPTGAGDAEGIEQLCCTNEDCDANQLCAPNATERPMQWHMSCRGK